MRVNIGLPDCKRCGFAKGAWRRFGSESRISIFRSAPNCDSASRRILRRRDARMSLHAGHHSTLSRQSQRSLTRPHRSPHRSAGRPLQRTADKDRRSNLSPNPGTCGASPRQATAKRLLQLANSPAQLRVLSALDESGERTLEMAVRRMNLSARAHDRVLRVARTIADLDSAPNVIAKHLAEAVQFEIWTGTTGVNRPFQRSVT